MQGTIKNKSTLPTGTRTITIAVNPAVGRDLHGDLAAGVTVITSIVSAMDSTVAMIAGLSPSEARDLARRLVAAADKADDMLLAESGSVSAASREQSR